MVFGSTEGEDKEEEVWKKDETNFETSALFEGATEFDGDVDVEEDIVGDIEDGHDDAESRQAASISAASSGNSEDRKSTRSELQSRI